MISPGPRSELGVWIQCGQALVVWFLRKGNFWCSDGRPEPEFRPDLTQNFFGNFVLFNPNFEKLSEKFNCVTDFKLQFESRKFPAKKRNKKGHGRPTPSPHVAGVRSHTHTRQGAEPGLGTTPDQLPPAPPSTWQERTSSFLLLSGCRCASV